MGKTTVQSAHRVDEYCQGLGNKWGRKEKLGIYLRREENVLELENGDSGTPL